MSYQARAFGVSLGIHAFVFTCIIASGMIVPRNSAVLLDFSIGNQPASACVSRTPAAEQQPRKMITPTAENENAAPLVQETKESPMAPVEQPVETPKDVNSESANTLSANNGSGEKTRYVSAQFAYIRDKIMKGLTYPMIARKMGWSGKVTVSFTVREDGSVEDIGIVESSGFAVLDKNAVETIKECCPLPKPLVKTALLMPIVYRLQ